MKRFYLRWLAVLVLSQTSFAHADDLTFNVPVKLENVHGDITHVKVECQLSSLATFSPMQAYVVGKGESVEVQIPDGRFDQPLSVKVRRGKGRGRQPKSWGCLLLLKAGEGWAVADENFAYPADPRKPYRYVACGRWDANGNAVQTECARLTGRTAVARAQRAEEKPDWQKKADLELDRVTFLHGYPRVGEPCELQIWLKRYYPPGRSLEPLENEASIVIQTENLSEPGLTPKIGGTVTLPIPMVHDKFSPAGAIDCSIPVEADYMGRPAEMFLRTKLTINLDYYDVIEEENENNNTSEYELIIYPENAKMADLAPEGFLWADRSGPVNTDLRIWGDVTNIGDETTIPFNVELECELELTPTAPSFKKFFRVTNPLAPGGVYRFEFAAQWPTPGRKVCRVFLDPDDEVIESDETNNGNFDVISVTIE